MSNSTASIADFISSLRACRALPKGKELHSQIVKDGLGNNLVLASGIVHMYLVCNSVDSARKVFDGMDTRDVGLWAPMMAAYARTGHLREATDLFHRMLEEKVSPDRVTFLTVLNVCSQSKKLADGRKVHRRIQGSELEWSVDVVTAIVRMYAKCGSLDDARRVFENRLFPKNVISWTTMASAYVESGMDEQAVLLFVKMLQEGVVPNEITYVTVLQGCDLQSGRNVHLWIEEAGLQYGAFVGNALIKMYRRCGSLDDARLVFHGIADKNLLVWNSMVAGHALLDDAQGTLLLFRKMLLDGWEGDKHTFLTVLDVCSSEASSLQAETLQTIHNLILESGLDSDTLVGTALMKMKSEQGDVEAAKLAFHNLKVKDLAAWNCLFSVYAKHSRFTDAMELREEMSRERVKPDKVTFLSILSACCTGKSSGLETGRRVHEECVELGLRLDTVLGTALVRMYASCGRLEDAKLVFEKMETRDLISWTTMLTAYNQAQLLDDASATFRRLQLEGLVPDEVTLVAALATCTTSASARELHERIRQSGWETHPLVGNALLEVYSACGSLEGAKKSFDGIREPSIVSWNVLLAAYARLGHPDQALGLLREMDLHGRFPDSVALSTVINSRASLQFFREGKTLHNSILEAGLEIDDVLATALVNFYGKCGDLATASSIFREVRGGDNVVTWNSTLAAYAQSGHANEAVTVLAEMIQHGIAPTAVTFVSVLSVCAHAGMADVGCHVFASLRWDYDVELIPEHYGCMIDLLARGGWLGEARQVLKTMPVTPDFAKWMALLSGCHVDGGVDSGFGAARELLQQDTQSSAAHVVLSNMYCKTK